ncbi:CIC11C00000004107 [Sungouiella intermedia]|uniref:U3 small nucleolar RNA-associated protein 11 n=1 Tax=Sungouiella intermedia TaxID=45354 RepID=A0A1L0FUP3_9ASCO|nr:CIC11C00000004107 [[Candida] intermedia]
MAKLVHNVQKKQHKERSQTLDRARYGLLEKKKDYKLRAADFHKKEAALKALKQKAAQYNPDEYYHAMVNKRTDDDGIIIHERPNEKLTTAQIKLLKSQDLNYVRTMRLNESHKISKLKNELGFKAQGKHTVFVDSEAEKNSFQPENFFGTDVAMLERRENRLRLDQLESSDKLIREDITDAEEREKLEKEKLNKYRLLKERMQREKELKEVEDAMCLTKELMKDGNCRKLKDAEGNIHYRWKAQRKK